MIDLSKLITAEDKLAQEAVNVRAERDKRLLESDFSQLPDATVNAQAWAVYRQALRGVPEQAGFPTDVVWPEKPQ